MASSSLHFAAQSSSKLLSLPAELRNRTWDLVLPARVIATKSNPTLTLPPLMIMCRQILCETLETFFAQTEFANVIDHWDGAFTHTFIKSFAWQRRRAVCAGKGSVPPNFPTAHVNSYVRGAPSWMNACTWARAAHKEKPVAFGLVLGPERVEPSEPQLEVGDMVIQTAVKLRSLPWKEVEAVLEDLHTLAIRIDPRRA